MHITNICIYCIIERDCLSYAISYCALQIYTFKNLQKVIKYINMVLYKFLYISLVILCIILSHIVMSPYYIIIIYYINLHLMPQEMLGGLFYSIFPHFYTCLYTELGILYLQVKFALLNIYLSCIRWLKVSKKAQNSINFANLFFIRIYPLISA